MEFESQINYWNNVATEKEFTTQLDFQLISDFVTKDSLILDYGCGYGRTLNELSSFGFKNLLGFDFSREMISRGKKQFPQLDLQTCENNKIGCNSNMIDLVILFAVLTCIIDNSRQLDLINEIKRVLKPDGLIYINDFLLNKDQRNSDRYEKFAKKYENYGVFELDEGAILRHHNEDWIFQLTEHFEREAYKKIKFKTMNGNISNGFVFIGRKK